VPPTRSSKNEINHLAFTPWAFTRWRRPSKVAHIWYSLLLIYRPRNDDRLSWPSWLTYSGRFTNITGHLSAPGQAQNRESSPAKDQSSTTEPPSHPIANAAPVPKSSKYGGKESFRGHIASVEFEMPKASRGPGPLPPGWRRRWADVTVDHMFVIICFAFYFVQPYDGEIKLYV